MQRSSNRPPPLSIDVVLGVGGGEPQTIHQRASSSGDDSPLRQPLLQGGNKSGRLSDRGCCWFHPPTTPLTWQYAFTIRGAECLHLYLWILKDLAWTQEWYYPSWVFGTLAVGWSLWLLGSSLYDRATNEVFIRTASLIWILGNWWWITGEVHDWKYPEDPPIYDERTAQTAYILDVGLCWLATFYLFIKPFKLFDADNPEMLIHYDTTGLPPRLLFFKTWREYENVHVSEGVSFFDRGGGDGGGGGGGGGGGEGGGGSGGDDYLNMCSLFRLFQILFWMAKDVAWANNAPAVWIFFSIPTIFMAWDFVYCSLLRKHLMVDHAHYCAMFVWVAANAVWYVVGVRAWGLSRRRASSRPPLAAQGGGRALQPRLRLPLCARFRRPRSRCHAALVQRLAPRRHLLSNRRHGACMRACVPACQRGAHVSTDGCRPFDSQFPPPFARPHGSTSSGSITPAQGP